MPVFSWVIVLELFHLLFQSHYLIHNPSLWVIQAKETIVFILRGFFGPYPFWFLKTCFFCYLLAYCGSYLRLSKYMWMFVTLIISQFVPHLANIDIMYPCFIVGMELKFNPIFFRQICRYYKWTFGLFILLLFFWDQFFWGYDGFLKTIIVNYVTNNQLFLESFQILYRLIIGIAGSLAFIGMACSIITQDNKNKFILDCCKCGQYTLGVYILQSILLEIIIAKYIKFDDFNWYFFNLLLAPVISFLILIICIYIIRTMMKSPKVAFYFLGNAK